MKRAGLCVIFSFLIGILVPVMANSESPNSEAGINLSTIIEEYCWDWATIDFDAFRLENNVWGDPESAHTQCIRVFSSGAFGWNWEKPNYSNQPYYPEVIYGKKPWYSTSTTPKLPIAVSSINSLEVDNLSISMTAAGSYNLAFDIFITSSSSAGSDTITHEIMIWFFWENVAIGLPHHQFSDGYNTYTHRTYGLDTSGSYHQFTISQQGIPEKVNIKAFLDHLIQDGHTLSYLASIELGNELWQGSGETVVNKLSIILRTSISSVGDVNSDCKIDIFDLAAIGICFGNPAEGACVAADVKQDSVINVLDLATVGKNFGRSC